MLYKCYIIVKVTHKIENYIIQFNNKKLMSILKNEINILDNFR